MGLVDGELNEFELKFLAKKQEELKISSADRKAIEREVEKNSGKEQIPNITIEGKVQNTDGDKPHISDLNTSLEPPE